MKILEIIIPYFLRTYLRNRSIRLASISSHYRAWNWAGFFWHKAILLEKHPELDLYINCVISWHYADNYDKAMRLLSNGLSLYPDNVKLMTERTLLHNIQSRKYPVRRYTDAELDDIRVDIVICVHNAYEDVVQCLSSIQSHTRLPFQIIIIDDASDPSMQAYLEAYEQTYENVRLLRNDENFGYTKSANRGLKSSQSEWVVLLNSDTEVASGWLRGLLLCAARDREIKAVGPLSNAASFQSVPRVRNDNGEFAVNSLPANWTPEDMNKFLYRHSPIDYLSVPLLNGFCTLFHRPTLELLGYLDEERFPVGYGEENDLCLRMVREGYRLVIATRVYVFHNKSSSFGNEARKKLTEQGVEQLKNKWPDYNYNYITKRVSEIPVLQKLRNDLLELEKDDGC